VLGLIKGKRKLVADSETFAIPVSHGMGVLCAAFLCDPDGLDDGIYHDTTDDCVVLLSIGSV